MSVSSSMVVEAAPSPDVALSGLAAAAAAGDPVATATLLTALHPTMYRYCASRLGHRGGSGLADDVAQEVCLAVLTSLPRYRDEGKSFLAFAYGIAAHKVADVHRRESRAALDLVADVPDLVDASDGPEARTVALATWARLVKLLAALPPAQREVVRLRVTVGLSAQETATALGMTPGAVRVAQHRALARLRQLVVAEPDLRP